MARRTLRTPKVHAEQAKRFLQVCLASSSMACGRLTLSGSLQLQSPDPLLVSLQTFNLETTATQLLARSRYAALLCNYQTGNRRALVSLNFHAEQALDLSNLGSTAHFIDAVARGNDLFRLFTADV